MSDKLRQLREFEYWYRKYYQRLFFFALTIVKNEQAAEDIVQDAFIKIMQYDQSIDPTTFRGYLFKAVRNQCLNYQRHVSLVENKITELNQLGNIEEIYRIDFVRDEPYQLFEADLKQEIQKVLSSLKPDQKRAFELSRFDGLKNKEVAEELGCSIKSVERYIATAVRILKAHFADQLHVLIFIELWLDLL